MNLLEVIILRVFLLLFSIPSCPVTENEATALPVETLGREELHAAQTVKTLDYTSEIPYTEEKDHQENPPYLRDRSFADDCGLKGGPEVKKVGSRVDPKHRIF